MKKLLVLSLSLFLSANAMAKDSFSICWSIYVGWMPWAYGAEEGIIKKWADKYDIEIDVVQINDYVESINHKDRTRSFFMGYLPNFNYTRALSA